MRFGGFGRPQDDDGASPFDPFFDHFGIGPVRGELVVAPHFETVLAKALGDEAG